MSPSFNHSYKKIKSPVGELTLIASAHHLKGILWEKEEPGRIRMSLGQEVATHPVLDKTQIQLSEYFAGIRRSFDLPIEFKGTDFQTKVWKMLCEIPYGGIQTYSELAQKINYDRAYRAVGSANRRNPLSIIIPCHRVISSSGTLSGFAGGIKAKEYLLELEKRSFFKNTEKR